MNDDVIDFRLLECLTMLVAECHVTRAAERLGMTQPRLSSALARLRVLTGDPLLIRTAKGMIPTDLAKELASSSHAFVKRWKSLVGREGLFKPESATNIFRVQALDSVTPDLLVPVLSYLQSKAPSIGLSISMPSYSTLWEALDTGEIDLAIGQVPNVPQDLFVSQLATHKWCCIAAANHPRIRSKLDLETYARESHAVLTFGRSHQPLLTEKCVDDFLEERDIVRHVGAYTPSVLALPDIIANTQMLALMPENAACLAAKRMPITLYDLPIPLPRLNLAMIWHARARNDPSHRWFRDIVRRATGAARVAV